MLLNLIEDGHWHSKEKTKSEWISSIPPEYFERRFSEGYLKRHCSTIRSLTSFMFSEVINHLLREGKIERESEFEVVNRKPYSIRIKS